MDATRIASRVRRVGLDETRLQPVGQPRQLGAQLRVADGRQPSDVGPRLANAAHACAASPVFRAARTWVARLKATFEAYQEEGLSGTYANKRNIDAKVKLTWRAIADADRPLAVDMRRLAAKFGYVDEAPASANK